MRIELVAIGNEILSGRILNTNAAFISEHLYQNGWLVERHTTLPDDPEQIRQGLQEALHRSAVVIVTGGLGPTCDDLTRHVIAAIFDSEFHYNQEVADDLIKRFGQKLPSLKDQATIPSKATPILNKFGTAPGLRFQTKTSTLFCLPGVPSEMENMFVADVLPHLHKIFATKEKIYSQKVHICLCTESAIDPTLRKLKKRYPELDVGIYPSYGTVTIVFASKDKHTLDAAKEVLVTEFATYVFESESGYIEEAVHQLLISERKTLALAESCTGGAIAARLTAIAGASDYFLGSAVVYSEELKHAFLHVSKNTLSNKGAVSEEVVREMLSGIFEKTSADYGIAVTGIAGPSGGTPEKPVGTIWAAVGERGKEPDVGTFFVRGSRKTIITFTGDRLLSNLWRKIAYGMSS
ncbi:MAG TPA: CinA family nicotinamide mononucleotide deamidase-related protein [Rhabdochlamydiaceae bacterium]|nr:CinA family nicotinamide mononucleotide deamidase-related protein [Rhabdochlamydiaceae bacterium]